MVVKRLRGASVYGYTDKTKPLIRVGGRYAEGMNHVSARAEVLAYGSNGCSYTA